MADRLRGAGRRRCRRAAGRRGALTEILAGVPGHRRGLAAGCRRWRRLSRQSRHAGSCGWRRRHLPYAPALQAAPGWISRASCWPSAARMRPPRRPVGGAPGAGLGAAAARCSAWLGAARPRMPLRRLQLAAEGGQAPAPCCSVPPAPARDSSPAPLRLFRGAFWQPARRACAQAPRPAAAAARCCSIWPICPVRQATMLWFALYLPSLPLQVFQRGAPEPAAGLAVADAELAGWWRRMRPAQRPRRACRPRAWPARWP
ncbi:MAG: hypothetical protein MZW92_29455 [Comamonadaceae bacterium]|nr:hypothetical protein [Comamonadaceae bacterium]